MIAKIAIKHRISSDLVFDYIVSSPVPLYSVVEVPFGSRKELGLIIGFKNYSRQAKKEVSKVISAGAVFNRTQITLAALVADYFISPFGPTLMSFLPNLPKKELAKIGAETPPVSFKKSKNKLVISSAENRIGFYLQNIAIDKQNLIVLPSVLQVEKTSKQAAKIFKSGFVYCWHSRLSPKQKRIIWQKCLQGDNLLVVGTRDSLFLPFCKLKKIFIDEPSSYAYFNDQLPYYNAFKVSRLLQKKLNSDLAVGESTPSLISYIAYKKGTFSKIEIKDQSKYEVFGCFESEIKIPSVVKKITGKLSGAKRILIVGPFKNKGRLICPDCGEIICNSCGEQIFNHNLTCTSCKKSLECCPKCHSQNIRLSGYQKQPIKKFFSKHLPATSIQFSDLEKIKVLPPVFDFAVIPYFTQMSKFPFIGYQEKMFASIASINSIVQKTILIFASEQDNFLTDILTNNWQRFNRQKLIERKIEGLPPFKKAIKIVFRDNRKKFETAIKKILRKFAIAPPLYVNQNKLGNKTEALIILDQKHFLKIKRLLKKQLTAKMHFIVDPVDFGL